MDQVPDWIVLPPMLAAASVVTLWMAGAIYFDVCGGGSRGRVAEMAWVAGVVAVFALWQPTWQPFAALLGTLAVFLVWWFRLKPSHDRRTGTGVWQSCQGPPAMGTR